MKQNNESGWTLIELMVSGAIIIIFATTSIPSMQVWYKKTICSEAIATLGVMDNALDKIIDNEGDLPYAWSSDKFFTVGTTMGFKYVKSGDLMLCTRGRWGYKFTVNGGNEVVISAHPQESVKRLLGITVDYPLEIIRSSPTADLSELHYKATGNQVYMGLCDQFVTGSYTSD